MNARNFEQVAVQLGGMDTRLRPAEGTASLIENMRYNVGDGTWSTMEGTVSIVTMLSEGVGLKWFNPRPNQKFLVVERRGSTGESLLSWMSLGGTTTAITSRRRVPNDDGGAETFVEVGRWLYFTSAFNAAMRWDGSNLVPVGFDRQPPPIEAYGTDQGVGIYDRTSGTYASVAGSSNWNVAYQRGLGERRASVSDDESFWRYGYGITVINDLGQESPMSSVVFASGENTVNEGRKMVRIRIPAFKRHVRGIRLWRTINVYGAQVTTGLPMYLHSEFSAAHGFDFVDHKSDGELLEEWDPDTTGPVPTGARAAAYWQGSLWFAGMVDDPSAVRYSAPSFPEQFPVVNRLTVGGQHTGRVLALVPVPRGLVVLKTSGTYIIKGNPGDGYRVEVVDETVGLAARRAVVYVPDLGLLWLHSTGPRLLTGTLDDEQPTRVQDIAGGMSDYWRRYVRGTRIEAAVAVYDPEQREVWFHVPHKGDNRPTLGLVLHVANQAWTVRTGWDIAGFEFWRGHLYAVGWNSSTVYRFSNGSRTPNLSALSTIACSYATSPVLTDPPMSVDKLNVYGRVLGSGNTFDVDTRTDRAQTWTDQTETSRTMLALGRDAPEWGTALWSASAYWDEENHTVTPVSLRTRTARLLELRLRSSTRLVVADLVVSTQGEGGPPPLERR